MCNKHPGCLRSAYIFFIYIIVSTIIVPSQISMFPISGALVSIYITTLVRARLYIYIIYLCGYFHADFGDPIFESASCQRHNKAVHSEVAAQDLIDGKIALGPLPWCHISTKKFQGYHGMLGILEIISQRYILSNIVKDCICNPDNSMESNTDPRRLSQNGSYPNLGMYVCLTGQNGDKVHLGCHIFRSNRCCSYR